MKIAGQKRKTSKLGGVCLLFTLMAGLILGAGCAPTQASPVSPEITEAASRTAIPTLGAGTRQPSPMPRPTAALSPTPPARPEARLIRHGDRTQPYLALTFDACQSPNHPAGYDEAIINILTENRTPATLFLGGLWMQRHPAQTRTLAANPLFELGNHAWSHADFAHLSPEEMGTEIRRTQQLMVTLTGGRARLFRFPSGSYTEEALMVVGQEGLQAVQWDVLSGDPDPRVSAGAMLNQVTTQACNGSIVIMHMNGEGRHTAEALPEIIRQLRAQGYTLVTVSQLLDLASPGGKEVLNDWLSVN